MRKLCIKAINNISKEAPTINNALHQLSRNKEIIGKNLCFIGLPSKWFAYGIAQALWMHGINKDCPIYYDNQTLIITNEPAIKLQITPIPSGFRLTILDADKSSFCSLSDRNLRMGEKIIHRQVNGNILDMSYTLDEKWEKENPYFITWNYQTNMFATIGHLRNKKEF